MRNITSYTIATLIAATMLTGPVPVLANDTGHHTKQADPSYWAPESSVKAQDAKVPAAEVEQKASAEQDSTLLQPDAHRNGKQYQAPISGDVR